MILIYDSETSDVYDFKSPPDASHQPHIVSIACLGFSDDGQHELAQYYAIIKPDGYEFHPQAVQQNGITHEFAMEHGLPGNEVMWTFMSLHRQARIQIAYNCKFDDAMIFRELLYTLPEYALLYDPLKSRCAMLAASACMKEPNPYPGYEHEYRWPKLVEAYQWLYKQPMVGAHNSMNDTRATAHFAFDLQRCRFWDWNTDRIPVVSVGG